MPGEEEVEGQAFKFRLRDGTEYEIPSDRIIGVRWTDADGEHEVEGHGIKFRVLSREPEVEGHGLRVKVLDQNDQEHEVDAHAARIRWRDNSGQEQEVEGHAFRYSDLRLKREVRPLRDPLHKLQSIG